MTTTKEHFIKAHKHCQSNREEISRSDIVGCFHCFTIFSPKEVEEWIGDTAICPACGVDSLIGNAAGYDLQSNFLKEMGEFWFHDAARKPAKGVRGCFLSALGVFRVYDDRKNFVDYEIHHPDLFLVIDDDSAYLKQTGEGEGFIDLYTGLKPGKPFIKTTYDRETGKTTDAREICRGKLARKKEVQDYLPE